MANRKPLFLNTTEGVPEEVSSTADTLTVGKVTLAGVSGVAIDAGGALISSVASPVSATDAASKAYVDGLVAGAVTKPSSLALADTNQSLTGAATIDGVVIPNGGAVLLTNQTSAIQNGIWLVNTGGAWARPTYFATGADAAAAYTFIQQGTVYSEQGWICISDTGSAVVGTNNLAFTQFTGLGEVTAGSGLQKTGNTISVKVNTNNTIAADINGVRTLGLPSLFTINTTAVGANVTAPNLDTLTGGGDASALHTHASVTYAKILEESLSNSATALAAGDPVYWTSTANKMGKADCAAESTSRVFGVAAVGIAGNASGLVIRHGIAVAVLSGATAGTPYYLAPGGGLTTTVPSGSGQTILRVGFAVNATDLEITIQRYGRRN